MAHHGLPSTTQHMVRVQSVLESAEETVRSHMQATRGLSTRSTRGIRIGTYLEALLPWKGLGAFTIARRNVPKYFIQKFDLLKL